MNVLSAHSSQNSEGYFHSLEWYNLSALEKRTDIVANANAANMYNSSSKKYNVLITNGFVFYNKFGK